MFVKGIIVVENLFDSDDICYMFGVLKLLGVNVMFNEDKIVVIVEGVVGKFNILFELLFLGNVGIVYCLLIVVFVVVEGEYEFVGELCMEECLIGYLVDVL